MRNGRFLILLFVIGFVVAGCSKPAAPPAQPAKIEPPAVPVRVEAAPKPVEETPAAVTTEAPAAPEVKAVEESPVAVAQAVEGGVPKLVVPEMEFNFGEMDNAETVDAKFILRNEGNGLLKIEGVRASCGCTATDLAKNELAPGEEVELHAATNLKGRQGPQTKAVTVTSNDPENPTVQLRIVGTAIASISIEPMSVQFGRVDDDEPRETTVVIQSNKEDISFKVLSAEIDGMDFVEHEIKEVQPGKKYELLVKTAGSLPVGNHNGRFIIRTDSQDRAVIWLPVSLQVIGPIQVLPPVVNIRYTEEPNELEQQQLSITSGRVTDFEITGVVVPLDSIEYELLEANPNAYRLRLSNMPRNDTLEGKSVILRTNIPDSPEIEIPFNIFRPRVRQTPPQGMPTSRQLQRVPANVEDVADAPVANQ